MAAEPGRHWSLQPRTRPAVPKPRAAEADRWIRTPIDAFIWEKLARASLRPAPEAYRQTLIRRVTFDLTGLPPTPEEVVAFVRDPAADAYEQLVERLLASPHYGERWGRHWLDVVRYAETEGFEYDRYRPGAWRYRDYVIAAFNEDRPFDRFVLEQVAGDELDANDPACLVAAGFHRLGPIRRNAGNKLVALSRNEVLTEMTDALGSVFLGLTVGCARCHNHKFDAISQKDYYRLQAFLAATQEHDQVLADAAAQAAWKGQTEKISGKIEDLQKRLKQLGPAGRNNDQATALRKQIKALKRSLPPPLPTISTVRDVARERTIIHVLKRGDPANEGERVGPRLLSALLAADAPELAADVDHPRLRLARWVTDPANPLTARVWVNRVWQYHFGQGIVRTPNDFGKNGAPPSHPELLDYLANEFIAGGQRLRPLQRMIVLSSTYRQASTAEGPARQAPELLARFPRRRLEAEEIRDAMLAVAGRLNLKAGGPSVFLPVDADLVKLLYDPEQWQVTPDAAGHDRRSIYLVAKRNLPLPFFQVFDQPDAQTSCPRREASTHALQALELLNGRFANRMAEALAARLERECPGDRTHLVQRAFWLTAGRPPSMAEEALALQFLERQPLREFALALFNLNAFLYVD
jgi:hypothetical protein